jgi:hypothetical protein
VGRPRKKRQTLAISALGPFRYSPLAGAGLGVQENSFLAGREHNMGWSCRGTTLVTWEEMSGVCVSPPASWQWIEPDSHGFREGACSHQLLAHRSLPRSDAAFTIGIHPWTSTRH